MKKYLWFACLVFLLSGCLTMPKSILLNRSNFISDYEKIRQIVIEEARNNGFQDVTSEIRPTELNDWEGRLIFRLKTSAGTDSLTVNFRNKDGKTELYMSGQGIQASPGGAMKAIDARIRAMREE